jgi:hypothetical protein
MPYKKYEDVNPAIKGIKPRVSLAQANQIAAMADAIKEKDGEKVKSPYAVAIANFKKSHTVRKGKWVKRADLEKNKEAALVVTTEEVELQAEEMYSDEYAYRPTFGATTFDDLEASRELDEKALELKMLITDLKAMIDNIAFSLQETDKIGAMSNLFNGFIQRAQGVLSDEAEEADPSLVEMSESYTAGASNMVEIKEGKSDLLMLDVKPIRPGWGNKRDNNYYPADMLKRDAAKFIGAKMFETDHKENEKSTRTWVSTVKDVIGSSKDGAPIVRVAVHDPNFAERVRNLNEAQLLEKMECSILGSARSVKNFERNGRKGKMIEAITDITSVDWVTRAGAGGHAVSLAENENGGITMKDQDMTENANQEATEEVLIEEQAPEQEQDDKSPEEPQAEKVGEDEVRQLVENSKLPETAQKRLMLAEYETEEAVQAAIQQELGYIKEITGSGQVFGMAENKPVEHTMSMAEKEANMDKINKKYIGG